MKSVLELQNLIQGFKLSCQTGNFHQQTSPARCELTAALSSVRCNLYNLAKGKRLLLRKGRASPTALVKVRE